MISGYSDHAANERTFLAWIRTGIAVIAFGFFIEKLNLFMLTLANTVLRADVHRAFLSTLGSQVGRYDGLVLIVGGLALVVLATVRFIRTARLIDAAEVYPAKSVRAELLLAAVLVMVVTSYAIYVAFT
jgi:putative membrane protein